MIQCAQGMSGMLVVRNLYQDVFQESCILVAIYISMYTSHMKFQIYVYTEMIRK
jgi:hypothetical protein